MAENRKIVDYSTKTVSRWFGFDRGTPIDRYFIERFISEQGDLITGAVLEIGDNRYTQRFGTDVVQSDVLDIRPSDRANIVGDLESGVGVRAQTYDCIILTQVLQVIYDLESAMENVYKGLKPGGSCLVTVSGISPIWIDEKEPYQEFWRFTDNSLARLFERFENKDQFEVRPYGNLAVAKAFLDGYALEDLNPEVLDVEDYQFQLTVAGRMTRSL